MDKTSPIEITYWGMIIATVLTLGSIAIAIFGFDAPAPTGVEIVATWTSYVCTWLCVYQSRTNYYWGMISVALYAWIFYSGSLYGSAATQLYLSGALIYGWWRWGPDAATRRVRSTPLKLYGLYITSTGVVWAGAVFISQELGGSVPFWDAAILAGTILAQFLLDNKRIETWAVWVAVNLLSIYIYWQAGWYLITIQYIFFLGNTLWGYYQWREAMIDADADEWAQGVVEGINARQRAHWDEIQRREDLAP